MRNLLSLVLAAALIGGQWAGQLHALSHAKFELALAAHAKSGGSDAPPPPLDHARDRCVAFHAVDCALDAPQLAVLESQSGVAPDVSQRLPLRPAERTPYHSRAPPILHEQS